jgi:flagellar hook protein FlgE
MSFSTLNKGVSGLLTNQTAIDITSNNIANISTVGFRGYNTEFSSLYEKAITTTSGAGHTNTIGGGVRVQSSTMSQNQGSLLSSESSTDLAIFGDGWFGVQNSIKGAPPLYTRNGSFSFDKNGDLVTDDGHYVLGTNGGNINDKKLLEQLSEVPLGNVDTQTKLRFPIDLVYPQTPSTKAKFSGNIGVEDKSRTISAGVVDGEGIRNNLLLEFTKAKKQVSPGTQWDITATTQTKDGETIYDTKTGTISFDDTGKQISNTLTTINNNGTAVSIDLGADYSGIVSTNGTITKGSSTDGNVAGDLVAYDINTNAEVIATFTNGLQSSVAKIAIYHFGNDQGLGRASGSKFESTNNSGKAIFFQNTNGENILGATLSNHNLESSNVTLDVALTELIIYQRSYDANSKIVTTSDQMIQKALQMSG